MFRASARAPVSASPSAAVCGRTVIESAPPTAAAKAATVLRRRLVGTSARVSMRRLVSACT